MKNTQHLALIGDIEVSQSDSYVFVGSYGELQLCFSRYRGDGLETFVAVLQAAMLESNEAATVGCI